ncbi:uncharacterized protein [Branchiostoma lanceolatum]|uniref:uncharacterized protein n=1 Tax=Branchiostoma lanceolatum TaxID=7740 RepID=UPI00345676E6
MGSNNNFTELTQDDLSLLAEMYPEELLTRGSAIGPVEKRRLVREARSAGKRKPRRGRKGKGRKRNGKRGDNDATVAVETNKLAATEEKEEVAECAKKTVRAPRPSESLVQLWSPMSKKGDGFLQVSKAKKTKVAKSSNLSAFKLQTNGKTDTSNTFFKWKVEEMDYCTDTGELTDCVSIKIAGVNIDPKDSAMEDKTFSVCLFGGKYIAVEDDPKTGTPDPEVVPKENCMFLCGYEEHLGWHITLKDSQQKLLGCDGSGKTRQLEETGNWPQYYPQPGSLFYLTERNKH